MNILDAAYRVGHDSPGGVAALAPRMGIGQAVLNSKLNPNTKTHILSVEEMVRMEVLTGRHDMLMAHAEALGFVAVPVPCLGDDDVDHAIATACAEFGDYLRTVGDALGDKKVTPNEAKRLEKELVEMISSATHLQALLLAKGRRAGAAK